MNKASPGGPTVKPTLSLLWSSSSPSGSLSLVCLLDSYSPPGASVSWTLGDSVLKEGNEVEIQTSDEIYNEGHFSCSSVLRLSGAQRDQKDKVRCNVLHGKAAEKSSIGLSSNQC
ncbi:hypothetical protein DNTS_000675 [Danionella cerebrum]|uniref:Ig-like domain-containing protein n=1 Tax=Danionella cerebrum TaxID=2873325 RepID=A0A553NGM5_9TELE|nr:hypothetical protein DNTS_002234 [Danionella translucida]TRY88097.1 hypothetical protein DNTS_000675 [Danionella translucida]